MHKAIQKMSAQHYFLDILTLCQTEKAVLVIPAVTDILCVAIAWL